MTTSGNNTIEKAIEKYFQDNKIECRCASTIQNGDKTIIELQLQSVSKLNKFNTKMENELSYILNKQVEIAKFTNSLQLVISNVAKQVTNDGELAVTIGNDMMGNDISISLDKEVHLLVGGSTGSGKSVFLNNFITDLSINYNKDIELVFIDLKKVELAKYQNLNNCIGFADDIETALQVLDSVINVMNERYKKYQEYGVNCIQDYNKLNIDNDRYLILVIDELAELMLQAKKDVTSKLQRLLQLGRASGIHVVACTQRPSADVVSGTLKVNFTSRLCFKVANRHDSATIINCKGAERLTGKGDALLLKNGAFELVRFQAKSPTSDSLEYYEIEQDTNSRHKTTLKTSWIVAIVLLAIVCGIPLVYVAYLVIKNVILICEYIFVSIFILLLIAIIRR